MSGIGTLTCAAALAVCGFASFCPSTLGDEVNKDAAAELDARRLVGKAYYENDKFAEAIEEFKRCTELAPDSATDHFNLALILMRKTDYEDSLRAIDQALKLDPDLMAAHYLQGIVYKRQQKYEEGIESLKHVIVHDPQCMGAYYNLGVCYNFLRRYEEAVEAFEGAVKVAPQHPSSRYMLITLYRRLGKVDEAKRHREVFDLIKDTVDESEKTAEALERSKYSYIIEAPRLTKGLTPNPSAKIKFVEWTTQSGLPELPAVFELEGHDLLFVITDAVRYDRTSLADEAHDTTPALRGLVERG
ncbi:MAG: tetratricopeptide repeat protein, partial [Phycisphaerales bacterium]